MGLLGKLPKVNRVGWPWDQETDLSFYDPNIPWPKISIVTPSFNQGKFIEETIRSVLLQNYPNLEYIIIDGGSTDSTIEIIKKYDKNVGHWVSEQDKGIYDAINKGIAISSGEYLYVLGIRDLLIRDVLFKVSQILCNEKPDLFYGNVFDMSIQYIYDGFFSKEKILIKNICQQSVFYSKTILNKNKKFNNNFLSLADYHFHLQAFSKRNIRIRYKDIIIANYRGDGFSANYFEYSFEKNKPFLFLTLFLFKVDIQSLFGSLQQNALFQIKSENILIGLIILCCDGILNKRFIENMKNGLYYLKNRIISYYPKL